MKLTLSPDEFGAFVAPTDVPIVTTNPVAETLNEYLLVCEARSTTLTDGYWRFSLETASGESVFDAEDIEIGDLNRLSVLAAVRGLEFIEGPSSITLLSNNRYLIKSLSDSLPRWRQNDFIWEHFGRRVDVQNADLWRRVDRALEIHRVEACLVSSRLVSRGLVGRHDQVTGDGIVTRRTDSPASSADSTASRSVVPAPKMASRRRGSRPNSSELVSAQSSDPAVRVNNASDRLRRLLMVSSSDMAPARSRFTSADLMDES